MPGLSAAVTAAAAVLLTLSPVAAGSAAAAGAARGNDARSRSAQWKGDYETGDFSQWATQQFVPGGARVVRSLRRQGQFSARFQVRPGDDPIGARGERSEVVAPAAAVGGFEGSDVWYGWATFLPSADLNPTVGKRSTNIFTQWHQEGPPPRDSLAIPPIRLSVDARPGESPPNLHMRVAGGSSAPYSFYNFDLGPATRDRWLDFVLHVKWSSNPRVGLVELWVNDDRKVRQTRTATLYRGSRVYLKQGYYRTESKATSVIYHDAMRRGRCYAAVDPTPDPGSRALAYALTLLSSTGNAEIGAVGYRESARERSAASECAIARRTEVALRAVRRAWRLPPRSHAGMRFASTPVRAER